MTEAERARVIVGERGWPRVEPIQVNRSWKSLFFGPMTRTSGRAT